ncbi:MAG: glycosyltransferase [Clostridia bacterium]|nr:glycosyltransferase [Clostridia bacterium]
MKVAILHHHLNPGGVTRIMQLQAQSLRRVFPEIEITIITGHATNPKPFEALDIPILEFPPLDYLPRSRGLEQELPELFADIINFLKSNIDRTSIIHAHNLNLGKNPVLTLALSSMVGQGYHLFNHCHDFAEDRPENMEFLRDVVEDFFQEDLQQVLYPANSNAHFATLNSFDYQRVLQQGVPENRLMLLPNPVEINKTAGSVVENVRGEICRTMGLDGNKLLITYPVRVIRRKNIGEFILLSVLFANRANWLVTLPPKNPAEVKPYQNWKDFCQRLKIKIVFEAGLKVDFIELLTASDLCLTTSIREGFGMVFLEPWLLGTPVMGRNISYVTADLMDSGVQFPLLYDEITVETESGDADFATLQMEQQQQVIGQVLQDAAFAEKVLRQNPLLLNLFDEVSGVVVENNRTVIEEKYSLTKYAHTLYEVYREMAEHND